MLRLGVPVPERSSIRRLDVLEPYVAVLARELAALAALAEDPAQWGFFVADPVAMDLDAWGYEGSSRRVPEYGRR